MRRPFLDQDHVAGEDAGGVGATSRVSMAPEDDGTIILVFVAKDVVKFHGKAIEMPDVKGTEVGAEGVV